MSENILQIEGQKDTPKIDFNGETGVLSMSGYSYPENVIAFYGPVFDWLDSYITQPADKTKIDLEIVYFNTASSKVFLELFKKLEKLPETSLEFIWSFDDDDFEMELAGEEFSGLLTYPVNLVKK